MIYHLHADTTGTDSIDDLLSVTSKITRVQILNIDHFDRVCADLLKAVTRDDSVILDTVSRMAATTRIDFRYGTNPEELLYDRYHAITTKKDQDNYGLYTNACNFIMRRLINLYNRGARIVTTVHEEDRIDPADLRKKHNMALNEEFRKILEASSSDIFRLSQLNEPYINVESGEVLLAKGTRLLHIRRTEELVAKVQLPIERDVQLLDAGVDTISLPRGDGGWSKMERILGKTPRWLTLYGYAGVGKTNFVLRRGPEPSVARIEPAQRKEEASA